MASRQFGSVTRSLATGVSAGLRRPLCRKCWKLLYGESRRRYSRATATWSGNSCSRWERHVRRGLATVAQRSFPRKALGQRLIFVVKNAEHSIGPMEEYNRRVREGILREDEHQKSMSLTTSRLKDLLTEFSYYTKFTGPSRYAHGL
jgi:hypothetical protein